MNKIIVWEPRWHDRVVLVADYKLAKDNLIQINYKDFPEPFYLTSERARQFPLEQMKTKKGGTIAMRAIPIDELAKEVI